MKGIDISEHNGTLDFNKIKEAGIEFVIIRVGWIGNKNNHTLDKRFEEYYKGAKQVGLKIGFYVYSYCLSETANLSGAKWVIEQIKNKDFSMPIFLDLEDPNMNEINKTSLTNQAITFCNYIEGQGKKAGIYANKYWFTNKLDINRIATYKIWLAEWEIESPSVNFRVDLWQYSSNGDIDGVDSRFDMNKCLNCQNLPEITEINKGDIEMKIYQNGNTKEYVFSDKKCTQSIGYLHPRETAECIGIYNNLAIIIYNVDNSNNKKIGFVKWLRWCRFLTFHVK